mmetsp:Transcript_642/g.697  ORF Transcript_642/g.697 Transcript_642/m.697 type:complete len:350 (+) Transcript_642:51-1100(+)
MEESKPEDALFSRQEYADKDFWDDRFAKTKGAFDWYASWDELEEFIAPLLKEDGSDEILMVGCGNSKLSSQMYDANHKKISNIDISEVVIEKMKEQYTDKPEMTWSVMDALDCTFDNDRFDIAIDKGTLDALVCGDDRTNGVLLVKEMGRQVKKGGHMVIITHMKPEGRVPIIHAALGEYRWEVDYHKCNLSISSQMINIMRSKLGKKPLAAGLKDKELLKKALLELMLERAQNSKGKKKKEPVVEEKEKTEMSEEDAKIKIKQAFEIYKLRKEQKKQREAQEKLEAERKSKERAEAEAKGEEGQTETTNHEQAGDSEQTAQNNFVYDPRRQNHCYVYLLKRINDEDDE